MEKADLFTFIKWWELTMKIMIMQLREQHPFCDAPAKDAQPESNHEETSDTLKLREIFQNN